MSKHNKALSSRLLDELWNQKNVAIVDELVAEKYVEHTLFFPGGISGNRCPDGFVYHSMLSVPETLRNKTFSGMNCCTLSISLAMVAVKRRF